MLFPVTFNWRRILSLAEHNVLNLPNCMWHINLTALYEAVFFCLLYLQTYKSVRLVRGQFPEISGWPLSSSVAGP